MRDRRTHERRDQTGAARHRGVAPVAARGRGHPDQQVKDRAAGDPQNDRQYYRAGQVELRADAGDAAAQSEDERPDQGEHQDQVSFPQGRGSGFAVHRPAAAHAC